MVTKYESFLLENIKNKLSLLLEGYLYGSGEFLFKIKKLMDVGGSVGQIATCIYNTINNERWFSDSNIKQNYFDITDSDDKVSFLQNDKLPDDFDEEDTPSLPYEMSRNEIKIGRIAKYILKLNVDSIGSTTFNDRDIELFVNAYKASKVDNTKEFKLVSGDDISKYYKMSNYYSKNGSLGNSCMAGESKKIFKIYTKNPDKVKLLVYLDSDDKVHARALVWKLDTSPTDCVYFMDRVYANSDSDVVKLINFAKEKDWMYKRTMNGHVSTAVEFIYKNEVVYGEIGVEVDGDFSNYPYLDTLPFLSKKKNKLTNIPKKKSYFLHSVDGECERCEDCGGDVILQVYGGGEEFCGECGEGHETLAKQGVETKWNKKINI